MHKPSRECVKEWIKDLNGNLPCLTSVWSLSVLLCIQGNPSAWAAYGDTHTPIGIIIHCNGITNRRVHTLLLVLCFRHLIRSTNIACSNLIWWNICIHFVVSLHFVFLVEDIAFVIPFYLTPESRLLSVSCHPSWVCKTKVLPICFLLFFWSLLRRQSCSVVPSWTYLCICMVSEIVAETKVCFPVSIRSWIYNPVRGQSFSWKALGTMIMFPSIFLFVGLITQEIVPHYVLMSVHSMLAWFVQRFLNVIWERFFVFLIVSTSSHTILHPSHGILLLFCLSTSRRGYHYYVVTSL